MYCKKIWLSSLNLKQTKYVKFFYLTLLCVSWMKYNNLKNQSIDLHFNLSLSSVLSEVSPTSYKEFHLIFLCFDYSLFSLNKNLLYPKRHKHTKRILLIYSHYFFFSWIFSLTETISFIICEMDMIFGSYIKQFPSCHKQKGPPF